MKKSGSAAWVVIVCPSRLTCCSALEHLAALEMAWGEYSAGAAEELARADEGGGLVEDDMVLRALFGLQFTVVSRVSQGGSEGVCVARQVAADGPCAV